VLTGLQYGCCKRGSTTLPYLMYYLQIGTFWRADERTRTADLLITSLNPPVTARTGVSGKYGVLQVFFAVWGGGLSVAYRRVLAGLRYGCGKSVDRLRFFFSLRDSIPPEPLHAIDPSLLGDVGECFLCARDEDPESLVLYAGGHQDHAGVRTSLTSPLPKKRFEVSYVGSH
jgi:hypothetical protein